MYREALSSRYASPSNGITRVPALLLIAETGALWGVLKAHSTAQLWSDDPGTHTSNSATRPWPLPLTVEVIILHGNTRHQYASTRAASAWPAAFVNAGRAQTLSTPANELQLRNDGRGEAYAISHENWVCPNRGTFKTSSSGHITTRAADICFQKIVPYGCNCEWLRLMTPRMNPFLHNILWTDEACFTREVVLNARSIHLWARDNRHAIRERGYQVRFVVSVWAGIVRDIVVGRHLLPDRLTGQRCRDFLETVMLGLLEDVLLAMR
jgi:hypothetical protein